MRSSVTTRTDCRPDGDRHLRAAGDPAGRAGTPVVQRGESVASYVETSIVIESRHGAEGLRELDRFLSRAGIDLVGVDVEQGKTARDAFSRFGKGRHAAGLNFGDCLAYALAHALGQTLLFKGGDFSKTDLPMR